MSYDFRKSSRRSILKGMAAMGVAFAGPPLLTGLRRAQAKYVTAMPDLPPDLGKGRSVAIIGAGVAGLTSAYILANAGFKVTVFEAGSRYGGRSLTVRPTDKDYKKWWFSLYNNERLFPNMYVDRYKEDKGPNKNTEQVANFKIEYWKSGIKKDQPVELFLNAGPGRIPSNHVNLIALCQEIGVGLEPYFFLTTSNLLQSEKFKNGKAFPFNQVSYSLFAEMAKLGIDKNPTGPDSEQLVKLYKQYGGLNKEGVFTDTKRLGYEEVPGGWQDKGAVRPQIPLDEILKSDFEGDSDSNPWFDSSKINSNPLFNSSDINWQASLMQPIGGMDRIWQQLLVQPVPHSAKDIENTLCPKDHPSHYVGDLVCLDTQIDSIANSGGNKILINDSHSFDYCISTMAPNLLYKIVKGVDGNFKEGLDEVDQTPAIKVGWQGKTRFWEEEDQIYGGISWTTDIISQIWYPSEDFTAPTGILTGAYNRGAPAEEFGDLNQAERISAALAGGEKLHRGFKDKVYADDGLTIAWQNMPHQVGGWASHTADDQPEIYKKITEMPQGRLYCAGDAWSYWPGWQEGAVTSAYCAINAIAHTIDSETYPGLVCNVNVDN